MDIQILENQILENIDINKNKIKPNKKYLKIFENFKYLKKVCL